MVEANAPMLNPARTSPRVTRKWRKRLPSETTMTKRDQTSRGGGKMKAGKSPSNTTSCQMITNIGMVMITKAAWLRLICLRLALSSSSFGLLSDFRFIKNTPKQLSGAISTNWLNPEGFLNNEQVAIGCLLSSGLYRRLWICTRSCSGISRELAGFTADREWHLVFWRFTLPRRLYGFNIEKIITCAARQVNTILQAFMPFYGNLGGCWYIINLYQFFFLHMRMCISLIL